MPSTFMEGQRDKRPHKFIAVFTHKRAITCHFYLSLVSVAEMVRLGSWFVFITVDYESSKILGALGTLPSQHRNLRDSLLNIGYAPHPSSCQVLLCLSALEAALTPFWAGEVLINKVLGFYFSPLISISP